MDEQLYIQALIELHEGLARQGPGDKQFSEFIISQLPSLPEKPSIADLGCGAGAGALLLAEIFQSHIKAVDFSSIFLQQLEQQAVKQGLDQYIETVHADMGCLDWEPESIDLLWSEGAAYSITFDGALKAWRQLLAPGGIVVISEMTLFADQVPEAITEFMQKCYSAIKTEKQNIDIIATSGYELLATYRLPSQAWWENYYTQLKENITKHKQSDHGAMQFVIRDTEQEMKMFEQYSDYYGYTFYIMVKQ
ncbi:MAG: class I SAM-dependent methyltransferase [Gammaproteobacteria bacterium]|nr:MAG: class I SAM-dependent methyltransferase [Gammaproteobacteria bacterium]